MNGNANSCLLYFNHVSCKSILKTNVIYRIQFYSLIISYVIKIHIHLWSQRLNHLPNTNKSIYFRLTFGRTNPEEQLTFWSQRSSRPRKESNRRPLTMTRTLTFALRKADISYLMFGNTYPDKINMFATIFILMLAVHDQKLLLSLKNVANTLYCIRMHRIHFPQNTISCYCIVPYNDLKRIFMCYTFSMHQMQKNSHYM